MANDVSSDGYQGQADETSGAEEFNGLNFLVNQLVTGKWTITLCKVNGVSGGGPTAPPGTVSVQPLVNQVDGQGNATPHGVINGIPVFRMQSGTAAVIMDPVAGDMGLLACASRDISTVISTGAAANPGSARTFSPSDGLYLGGFLNKAPTQFLQMSGDGIVLQFSTSISITINSSGIVLKAGSAMLQVANNGQITINNIVWDTHVHTDVTVGAANSGPPFP
jgi:hypothetical protein